MRILRLIIAVAVLSVVTSAVVVAVTTAVVSAMPQLSAAEVLEPIIAKLSDAPPLPPTPDPPPQRSVVLARDGSVVAHLVGEQNRVRLSRDEIPDVVVDAVLASEDNRFYEHTGIDHVGIARALVANVRAGEIEQGGSTITQQLVENAYLPKTQGMQGMQGKIDEASYALQLERRLSKDEILTRYLNRVYFGKGAYGIAAAAERYFSKPVHKLRVDQVAMLIGLVRAPSALDPIDHPDRARRIRDVVLGRMADSGRLEQRIADKAARRELKLRPKRPPRPRYPFFAAYVEHELLTSPAFDGVLGPRGGERRAVLEAGGLRIHTTLSPRLQHLANKSIRRVMSGKRVPQATVVTVKPGTGAVLAMAVGPREFGECKRRNKVRCSRTMVNPAVADLGGGGRQPGSAFKPFVATAALREGIPRGWEFRTEGGKPIPGCADGDGRYKPRNYSPDPGVKDMTTAMRVSNNVYFAKLGGLVGPKKVVRTARTVGLTQADLPTGCSVALGSGSVTPLQMATSYATFAADGTHCAALSVRRIDLDGKRHKIRSDCERALSKRVAKQVTTLLREPVRAGTATRVRVGRPVAGKTGTTQDYKDAWFVGYVPQLTTAVWVGHEQPREMRNVLGQAHVTGGSIPAQLWTTMMKRALRPFNTRGLPSVDTRRVRVPDFVGKRIGDVRDDVEYKLRFKTSRVDHHRPKGTIVRQRPRPGTRVDAGSYVTLRVSNGRGEKPTNMRNRDRDRDDGDRQRSAEPESTERDREDEPREDRDSQPKPRVKEEPSPDATPAPEPEPTNPEPSEPEPSEPEPDPTDNESTDPAEETTETEAGGASETDSEQASDAGG